MAAARTKPEKTRGTALSKPYVPTAREQEALALFAMRREAARSAPFLKAENIAADGEAPRTQISVDHQDNKVAFDLMMEALAVAEYPLFAGLLKDLAGLGQEGKTTNADTMNYAMAIARGINPHDPTEALLATQMAAVHMTTMRFANYLATSLAGGTNPQKIEGFERSMNRLARTFTAQVEALKRYRSKGEQRVYVERVNVEPGGQAIVGNVHHGGGGGQKNGG